jgi:hypothetical protein
MDKLESAVEANLLTKIAHSSDNDLSCPTLTLAFAQKFFANGWIKNAAGDNPFVITDEGRRALELWNADLTQERT